MELETTFKKISKEVGEKIISAMDSAMERKEFVEISKINDTSAKKNGTFKFKITSETLDRSGDVILFDSWNTKFFEENPVVLWGHNYLELPIGKATKLVKDKVTKIIHMEGVFASHSKAQEVRKLYDEKFINTCSVGFIPEEYEKNEKGGFLITKAQLLEVSIVPVPANQEALSSLAVKNFNITNLINKNLIEVKGIGVGEDVKEDEVGEVGNDEVVEEEVVKEEENEDEGVEEEVVEGGEEEVVKEVKKEKIRKVFADIDKKKLQDVLSFLKDIDNSLQEEEEEEKEEEENDEVVRNYQLNKKITQACAKLISGVLFECKRGRVEG